MFEWLLLEEQYGITRVDEGWVQLFLNEVLAWFFVGAPNLGSPDGEALG